MANGTSVESITRQFDAIKKRVQKLEADTKAGTERDMYRACIVVQNEVQKVIRDYNRGVYERYPGDLQERAERGYPNNPLRRTGMMGAAISIDVEKQGDITTGKVVFNTKYAKYLNDGTEDIAPYRFKEIAMVMAEDKVKKILGIGGS